MMIYTITLYTCLSALQTIPTVTLWMSIDFLKDDSPFDIFKLLDRLIDKFV